MQIQSETHFLIQECFCQELRAADLPDSAVHEAMEGSDYDKQMSALYSMTLEVTAARHGAATE